MPNTVYIDGATTPNYVVTVTDDILNVNTTGGAVNIFFTNILTNPSYPRTIQINDVGNFSLVNNIIVYAAGGNLINGYPIYDIQVNGASVTFTTVSSSIWLAQSSGSGGGGNLSFIAGEKIVAPCVVVINNGLAYKYQQSSANSYDTKIGIAVTDANISQSVSVVMIGKANVQGAFVQNAIYYAGANGTLTTIAPTTSGVSLQVGVGIDTDNLLVDCKNPILIP
jgi:hypothetical protein